MCDMKECPMKTANLGVITIPFPLSLCIIIICFSGSQWVPHMMRRDFKSMATRQD